MLLDSGSKTATRDYPELLDLALGRDVGGHETAGRETAGPEAIGPEAIGPEAIGPEATGRETVITLREPVAMPGARAVTQLVLEDAVTLENPHGLDKEDPDRLPDTKGTARRETAETQVTEAAAEDAKDRKQTGDYVELAEHHSTMAVELPSEPEVADSIMVAEGKVADAQEISEQDVAKHKIIDEKVTEHKVTEQNVDEQNAAKETVAAEQTVGAEEEVAEQTAAEEVAEQTAAEVDTPDVDITAQMNETAETMVEEPELDITDQLRETMELDQDERTFAKTHLAAATVDAVMTECTVVEAVAESAVMAVEESRVSDDEQVGLTQQESAIETGAVAAGEKMRRERDEETPEENASDRSGEESPETSSDEEQLEQEPTPGASPIERPATSPPPQLQTPTEHTLVEQTLSSEEFTRSEKSARDQPDETIAETLAEAISETVSESPLTTGDTPTTNAGMETKQKERESKRPEDELEDDQPEDDQSEDGSEVDQSVEEAPTVDVELQKADELTAEPEHGATASGVSLRPEFTPEESTPEKSAPEESAPEESAPEESAPEESTPEGSTPEESTPEESTPEKSAPEESAPEKSAPEESTPEESTPEEEATRSESGSPERPPTGSVAAADAKGLEFEDAAVENEVVQGLATAVPSPDAVRNGETLVPEEAGAEEAGPEEAGPEESGLGTSAPDLSDTPVEDMPSRAAENGSESETEEPRPCESETCQTEPCEREGETSHSECLLAVLVIEGESSVPQPETECISVNPASPASESQPGGEPSSADEGSPLLQLGGGDPDSPDSCESPREDPEDAVPDSTRDELKAAVRAGSPEEREDRGDAEESTTDAETSRLPTAGPGEDLDASRQAKDETHQEMANQKTVDQDTVDRHATAATAAPETTATSGTASEAQSPEAKGREAERSEAGGPEAESPEAESLEAGGPEVILRTASPATASPATASAASPEAALVGEISSVAASLDRPSSSESGAKVREDSTGPDGSGLTPESSVADSLTSSPVTSRSTSRGSSRSSSRTTSRTTGRSTSGATSPVSEALAEPMSTTSGGTTSGGTTSGGTTSGGTTSGGTTSGGPMSGGSTSAEYTTPMGEDSRSRIGTPASGAVEAGHRRASSPRKRLVTHWQSSSDSDSDSGRPRGKRLLKRSRRSFEDASPPSTCDTSTAPRLSLPLRVVPEEVTSEDELMVPDAILQSVDNDRLIKELQGRGYVVRLRRRKAVVVGALSLDLSTPKKRRRREDELADDVATLSTLLPDSTYEQPDLINKTDVLKTMQARAARLTRPLPQLILDPDRDDTPVYQVFLTPEQQNSPTRSRRSTGTCSILVVPKHQLTSRRSY